MAKSIQWMEVESANTQTSGEPLLYAVSVPYFLLLKLCVLGPTWSPVTEL